MATHANSQARTEDKSQQAEWCGVGYTQEKLWKDIEFKKKLSLLDYRRNTGLLQKM